ncbi:hypothetical protein M2281_001626 [Mesorhizobium soli]|uniref:polysaccharide pyruvyl transferase family protein n=1 Tax=Pseudaminobacter soli (ex Li et al. 2025) TaxID=1295366 RepID=UPI002476C024|nr:polysaccharide pyruvyl transferase family protein [Mesorhizobium soli]MDH6231054.1 hypothetical protein [Mesorhizobium soli]
MKISLLTYSNSNNIGDNIQTIAVSKHIDQRYDLVDRDFINSYNGEPCVVVMNGWFTHEPRNWPPAPGITPVFFGFHLIPELAAEFEKHKAYFERFAPIGCRDQATADMIKSWGVEAYVSGCATMTFKTRSKEPDDPKIIFVDHTRRDFHRGQRKGCIELAHEAPFYISGSTAKFAIAGELLNYYRQNAGLVVTSRIHCAMPCAAMGIPVVYTGKRDGRTAIIDMIGIPTVKIRHFPRTKITSLPAQKPSFEDVKRRVTSDLHARLSSHGVKVRAPCDG